jgi:GNAT superfamily N-acetyltransferase
MLKFAVETWADIWRDGQEIFKQHYDELALHKEAMPMGLDNDFYTDLQARNFLLVVTARRDGRLVGYYMAIVVHHHPHNKDAGAVSTTDFFYILPHERKGGAGAKLLAFVGGTESLLGGELARSGIKKATLTTKRKFANIELMEALGWSNTDLVFQKVGK